MFNIFIIADENEKIKELQSGLAAKGFTCSMSSDGEKAIEQAVDQSPDLILVEINGRSTHHLIQELFQGARLERHLPVMALINEEMLSNPVLHLSVDDFIIEPCDVRELAFRAHRLIQRINNVDTGELIKCGSLSIDMAKCEVSVDGRPVMLTFKEYELLKLLARNKGRVFSRETILNKVWGYDYFGGDRTVDVHVRRLRSKIEDPDHSFVETVRNIGYRFKEDM